MPRIGAMTIGPGTPGLLCYKYICYKISNQNMPQNVAKKPERGIFLGGFCSKFPLSCLRSRSNNYWGSLSPQDAIATIFAAKTYLRQLPKHFKP